LIYSSPFLPFALFKSQVGLRAQEGSQLAIGASKAPVAVFERARSQEEGKEEGSHLALGASRAPVAVFERSKIKTKLQVYSCYTALPSKYNSVLSNATNVG
jgi:hypothetical protein